MAQQQQTGAKQLQRWHVKRNVITERYHVVRGDGEFLTGRSGFPLHFSTEATARDACKKANDKAGV